MNGQVNKLPHRIQKICRLSIPGGDRFLDIGCGNGAFAILFGEIFGFRNLYGVDVSIEAVNQANERGVNAICADADKEALPYDDGYFDVVFAGEVIEHLLNSDFMIDEIFRVLKLGGMCIVTTPNLASWYNRIQLLFGYQPYAIPASHIHRGAGALWSSARDKMVYGDCYSPSSGITEGFKHHISFYTVRSLVSLLEMHGFRTVTVAGASFDEIVFQMPGLLVKMVKMFDMVVSNIFSSLASRSIIVVKRPDDAE